MTRLPIRSAFFAELKAAAAFVVALDLIVVVNYY